MRALVLATLVGALCALSPLARASGVEPTKISLPKGPGSIEGLGRNFEPSLASGTASYGVEIAVPPAVGSFGPKISLEYDSGLGVSELGIGWRLSGTIQIRRRTHEGLPRFGEHDAWELIGLGMPCDLIEVASGLFRPQYETGAFVRIRRSDDGLQWEVRDKSGITYRFGGEGASQSEGGKVQAALLREQLDLHGHKITYQWDASQGHALLTKVIWNDSAPSMANEVVFEYEQRPDVHSLFSSGISQRIEKRIKSIEVRHAGELVRRYELSYELSSHKSRLAQVRLVGRDGVTSLAPLRLDYTEASLNTAGQIVTMKSPPGRSPSDANVDIADLNGDGLVDLLVTAPGQFRSYVNQDGLSWLSGRDWLASQSPSVALSSLGVQLADVDGDGAIDLLVKSGASQMRYFPGQNELRFASAVSMTHVPNIDLDSADARLADMDGDRRVDIVLTTAAGLSIGYNQKGLDWGEIQNLGTIDSRQSLRFSDGRTQLCDINGDRLQDFCYLHSGSLLYWLGRGRGIFEPAQTAIGVPSFDPSSPWELHDLDGDGWSDLVHVGVTGIDYALAEAEGKFEAPKRIENTPEKGPNTAVRFADMNGSGTIDIVWINVSGSPEKAWQYLELFPQGRGGLLQKIQNGLGKVVTIHYAGASEFAAQARLSGQPWTSRMNVPMTVVDSVTVDSSLGDPLIRAEYVYQDGTWDPKERTFAGFASGENRAMGDEHTPTLVSESWFDTGLEHLGLRGAVLKAETRTADGKVFERGTSEYHVSSIARGLDGRSIEYGYKSSELIEHIEGGAASESRSTLTEWEQDEFGNVTEERKWGEVSGDNKLIGGDEAIIRRRFANNVEDWILGRVASEVVEDSSGVRVAEKRYYYDGEAFTGLALGALTRGDLMRTASWIADDRFANESQLAYDKHGNVIVALDARGGRAEYDYDELSHTFIIAERRFADDGKFLEWKAKYDPALGALVQEEGLNGEITEWAYSPLGLLEKVVHPGDSLELPSQQFSYEFGSPLSAIRAETRERSGESGTLSLLTHVDGLGRPRAVYKEGASAGEWIVTDLVRFDARGNKWAASLPFSVSTIGLVSPEGRDSIQTTYDAKGRAILVRQVDGSVRKTDYGPFQKWIWDENDTDPQSPHYKTPKGERYDGLGRLREVIDWQDSQQLITGLYQYDPAGKLTEVADVAGQVRHYQYDGRGRRTSIDDPNAGHWSFEYTDGNDVARQIDPTGQWVRFSYDKLGRALEEWHESKNQDERLSVRYHYDEPSSEHSDYANTRGQLAWVQDEAGAVYLGYDAQGREVKNTRRWHDGQEHTSWTEFDASHRVQKRGYPDGSYLEYAYNNRGLLRQLGPLVGDIEYNAHGTVSAMRLGNGTKIERQEDRRMRLERISAEGSQGESLFDLHYELDKASRIVGQQDLRPNMPETESLSAQYQYDSRYRLVQVKDPQAETRWELDPLGRILSVQSGHPQSWLNVRNQYEQGPPGAERLIQHGAEKLAYDERGQVIQDGDRQLTWNVKGQLIRVARGPVAEEYVYDYEGKRAEKLTKTETQTSLTRYIDTDCEQRDGRLIRYGMVGSERLVRLDSLLGEKTEAGQATGKTESRLGLWQTGVGILVLGLALWPWSRKPRPLAKRGISWAAALVGLLVLCLGCVSHGEGQASGAIKELPKGAVYYLNDVQKSASVLLDAQGNAIERRGYHPYGSERIGPKDSPEPFGYVGAEKDKGSGLGDFGARPYRYEASVFYAPDPVAVFHPEKTLQQPERLSAYQYSGGDPINRTDPAGQWWDIIADAAFIVGDLGYIAYDNVYKGNQESLPLNTLALTADVTAAAIPFFTGAGLATRASAHAVSGAEKAVVHGGAAALRAEATVLRADAHLAARSGAEWEAYFVRAAREGASGGGGAGRALPPAKFTTKLLPERAGPIGEIAPGEVIGRTPAEIHQRASELGLEARGPAPMEGRGAYIDPQTRVPRIMTHTNDPSPHGHVNNPAGQRIGPNGQVVPPKSPEAHLPIKVQ